VTKQRTTKWAYIANAVLRICKKNMNKAKFLGARGNDRTNIIAPGSDPEQRELLQFFRTDTKTHKGRD